jgi:hypothetical protein
VRGEQAVATLEVRPRPAPDAAERLLVIGDLGEQERVGLALGDRVAALVAADHTAVAVDVAVEEAARGVAGRRARAVLGARVGRPGVVAEQGPGGHEQRDGREQHGKSGNRA